MKQIKKSLNIYKTYIEKELSTILRSVGININTVPVLDRLYKFTNNFLKTRIYSVKNKNYKIIIKICIDTYAKNKISTVIKHIPGHGLAKRTHT